VDGGQLLLLAHLDRHIAYGDDQVSGMAAGFVDRRSVHVEITVVFATQIRGSALAGRQRRLERAEVRPQYLRTAEHRIELFADGRFARTPLAQSAVAPEDRVVAVQQHDPVGHALENLLVL
jgi:hypothetical protein